jgi:GGDEF domain-containing protein
VKDIASQACGDARLGISMGEAYYPGDGLDAEDLLAGADLRMYKAKQEHKSGRPQWRSPKQLGVEKHRQEIMVLANDV